MKKLISLMLALLLTVALAVPALAVETEAAVPQYTQDAEALYKLGLFKGVGSDENGNPKFNLEGKCTRLQALVILLRLLGLEEEALATTAENPFTDIPKGHWGEKYVAYAYSIGLTNGVGNNKFGDGDATPVQFATFTLRALGYDDRQGDFKYSKAVDKARELNVIPEGMFADGSNVLLRDTCVNICVNALKTDLKDGERTLAKKLLDEGVIEENVAVEVGVLPSEPEVSNIVYVPIDVDAKKINIADVKAAFPNAAGFYAWGMGGPSAAELVNMKNDPEAILLNVLPIRRYLEGNPKNLAAPEFSRAGQENLYLGNKSMTYAVVVDKDYNMIAYCVTPYGFTESEMPFILCNVEGKPVIERAKALLDAAKKLSADAFYMENHVTTKEDGTTNTTSYLKVNRNKLPAGLGDIVYFSFAGSSRGLVPIWLGDMSHPLAHLTWSSSIQNAPFHALESWSYFRKGDLLFIFYNADREIIGYANINPSELNTVEIAVEN